MENCCERADSIEQDSLQWSSGACLVFPLVLSFVDMFQSETGSHVCWSEGSQEDDLVQAKVSINATWYNLQSDPHIVATCAGVGSAWRG